MAAIAIVGMHCRVPGADDIATFWRNVCAAHDAVTDFDDDDLLRAGVAPALLRDPAYVRARAVIAGEDRFDAAFFGYTPREAELMDPQQRVFLEGAWHALEDAGCIATPPSLRVGVFAGCGLNTYLLNNLSADRELIRTTDYHQLLTATDKDYLATRVSYKLDLRGPSITVATACSTSLVAIHLAAKSVANGECEIALAGGVTIPIPQDEGFLAKQGGVLAPDGRCRTFDAAANGIGAGSGLAIVVLRRLDGALAAGNRVYAVVRGSAVNNDGAAKVGFTAPSVTGQAAVIGAALADAAVEASTIGYVEAHGTGTPLGDPIEVAGLAQAYRANGVTANGACAIGSVKTNVGHLDAAAGAIGFVKAALALYHRTIPPACNFERPNPQIDFANSPFRVADRLAAWPVGDAPRRAAVSSFGLGGTNAHVVLEEAPAVAPSAPSARAAELLVVSAKTGAALAAAVERVTGHLAAYPEIAPADAAFTLTAGRRAFAHRRAVVWPQRADATDSIGVAPDVAGSVAFYFADARDARIPPELYACEPAFRHEVDRCAELLRAHLGADVRDENATARAPRYATSFTVQYALAALWRAWGVHPHAMAAAGAGEYVAACVGGVLALEDALELIALRERFVGDTFGEAQLDEFLRLVERFELPPVRIPWISGATGSWVAAGSAAEPAFWLHHLRAPVSSSVRERLERDRPGAVTIEIAPERSPHEPHDSRSLFAALGRVWAAGVEPDWSAVYPPGQRRIVTLPGYAFERTSYWIAPPRRQGEAETTMTTPAQGYALETLARVKAIVASVSGLPLAEIADASSMFDLGLDSLALIQVNQALKEQLGVKITLQDLLEDLSEVGALACRVEALLAPERPAVPQPAVPQPVAAQPAALADPAPDAPSSAYASAADGVSAAAGDASALERIVTQQLDVMRLQLEMVRGGAARSAATPAARAERVCAPEPPAKKPLSFASATDTQAHALPEAQQRHLDALVERYTARTRRSKDYAAAHRAVLADSRAAVGFRASVKEMLYPIVVARGAGARFRDLDDNEYVDLTNGFGVTMFGHHPPFVKAALEEYANHGIVLGPRSPLVGEAAQLITELTGMERVAFCNSGTEAVMAAIRVARTRTGRSRIVVFDGSYHGHSDQTLVQSARRGGEAFGEPIAPGIPPEAVAATIALEYGTPESLEYVRAHAHELAAVLVEPVQNMRLDFQPVEFLRELRAVTAAAGTALIFDEMITGFRLHPAGAQGYFGVRADVATYGKVIGGGMPIGVVAGKAEFLDAIDGGSWAYGDASHPAARRTFFGGTFCQHPLTMVTALATLRELVRQGPQLQERLNARTAALATALNEYFAREDVPAHVAHFGSAFRISLPSNLDLLFYHLIEKGVYVWEWRGCFLTTAHSEADIEHVVRAVQQSVDELRNGGYLPPRPSARAAEFALTVAQRQLVALANVHPDGALAYKMGLSLELHGTLHVERLEAALAQLVERHESLRTVIRADGRGQIVQPPAAPAFAVTDLSAVAPAERDGRLAAWFRAKNEAPLDLERGPLFRCDLLRLAREEHVLVLTAHHVVSDGWSLTNLVGELMALYSGRVLPAAMQYRDYVAWRQSFERTGEHAAHEAYWLSEFADGIPLVELPLDHPRPAERNFRAARRSLTLAPELTRGLKAAFAQRGCTLFIGLYAAYVALMHRFTGRDDFLIGIAVGGRGLDGADSLFGYCTHLLPVRTHVDAGATFGEHLARTKKKLGEAYAHQDYPFAALVEKLDLRRDVSRAPLVPAVFNLDKPTGVPAGDGLRLELFPHPIAFADFELMLNAIDLGDRMVLDCDFNTALFEPATAERLLESYRILLEGVVANPAERVARLPLLEEQERTRLLGLVAAPATVDLGALVHEQIEAHAARTPDAVALRFEGAHLTYAELNARANRLAHALRARGAAAEVLVGVCLEPSLELVVALLAVLKAGAAYVPLDPSYPANHLAVLLEDACPPIVITEEQFGRRLVSQPTRSDVFLDADRASIAAQRAENPGVASRPHDLAYVIYTSGTTGKPKGVLVQHDNLARLFRATAAPFEFGASDVWVLAHSFAFDFSVWEIFGALVHGGRLVVLPRWTARDPGMLYHLLCDEGVTVLNQTPSAFRQLAAAESAAGADARLRLRWVILGGEALDFRSLAPWFATHGDRNPQLVNMYGITETTVHVTVRALCAADAHRTSSGIGRALPDLRVYVLDDEMQPTPPGVAGEIYVGGAGVARGYLNDENLTRERFVPSPFTAGDRLYRSGDVARRVDDELEYLGRADEQVKIRGFRIELGEIEAVLRAYPNVADAVAVQYAALDAQPQLVAYVIGGAGGGELALAALRAHVAAALPAHMVPAAFVPLERLPLTLNGKLDRAALPRPDAALEPEASYVEPRNALEEELAEIWAEVLGLDRVGVHADFFELGGDSIVAMQVIARANASGWKLTQRELHAAPTVAELAAARSAAPDLTPIQRWFFAQRQPRPEHHNMAVLLEVVAGTDPDLLEGALRAVGEHHPALRTGFRRGAAGWEPFVARPEHASTFERFDLTGLTHAEQNREIELAGTRLQSSLRLDEPPLLCAAYFACGPHQTSRLLVSVHHLVIDGVSWRIVLEQLQTAYRQLRHGRAVQLPAPSVAPNAWAQRLEHYVRDGGFAGELPFWNALGSAPPLPRDVDGAPERNTFESEAHVAARLDGEITQTLLETLARTYGARADDALLAALTCALSAWLGQRDIVVELEGHGREAFADDADLDASRSVGWFTSIHPLRLELAPDAPAASALRAVQAVRARVPRNGVGYLALLHLSGELRPARADILMNYLGQFQLAAQDGFVAGFARERCGPERSPRNLRSHVLEINAYVSGGSLQIDLAYSTAFHRAATIEMLAAGMTCALRELAHAAEPVAADLQRTVSAAGGQ